MTSNAVQSIMTSAAITGGPPIVLLVVSPGIFYASIGLLWVTCAMVCINIIISTLCREKRFDLIATRAVRRALERAHKG